MESYSRKGPALEEDKVMVSRPGKPINFFGAYDRQFVLHDIVIIGEDDQMITAPTVPMER